MSPLKLHYEDIASLAKPLAGPHPLSGYDQWSASAKEWGFYQQSTFSHNHIRIHELITDFERDCQIQVQDTRLADSVHICMPLSGSVSANFKSCRLFTELHPKRHHHVYVPAAEYELVIAKKSHLLHIEIEREYFSTLLCDSETWSATLREKLMRKDLTHSGDRVGCLSMQKIIRDILYTPLTGNLKKIFLEAKVLELIALQLDHSRNGDKGNSVPMKKQDRDALVAVHDYLTEHFAEEQSLQGLSKRFGLNEFKLKKGFKSLYGKTVFDYLFELKMGHARHLLLDEGKLVCEVSREVGYKNSNHFSTAFKKKFGVNPKGML